MADNKRPEPHTTLSAMQADTARELDGHNCFRVGIHPEFAKEMGITATPYMYIVAKSRTSARGGCAPKFLEAVQIDPATGEPYSRSSGTDKRATEPTVSLVLYTPDGTPHATGVNWPSVAAAQQAMTQFAWSGTVGMPKPDAPAAAGWQMGVLMPTKAVPPAAKPAPELDRATLWADRLAAINAARDGQPIPGNPASSTPPPTAAAAPAADPASATNNQPAADLSGNGQPAGVQVAGADLVSANASQSVAAPQAPPADPNSPINPNGKTDASPIPTNILHTLQHADRKGLELFARMQNLNIQDGVDDDRLRKALCQHAENQRVQASESDIAAIVNAGSLASVTGEGATDPYGDV